MDNSDIDKEINEVQEKINEHSLTYEVIMELKQNNKRTWSTLIVVVGLWFATIVGFILYLNQYDYTSTYEYTATGVNAIIDNSGNVIAQDIPENQLQQILEILNGESNIESKEGEN